MADSLDKWLAHTEMQNNRDVLIPEETDKRWVERINNMRLAMNSFELYSKGNDYSEKRKADNSQWRGEDTNNPSAEGNREFFYKCSDKLLGILPALIAKKSKEMEDTKDPKQKEALQAEKEEYKALLKTVQKDSLLFPIKTLAADVLTRAANCCLDLKLDKVVTRTFGFMANPISPIKEACSWAIIGALSVVSQTEKWFESFALKENAAQFNAGLKEQFKPVVDTLSQVSGLSLNSIKESMKSSFTDFKNALDKTIHEPKDEGRKLGR